MTAFNLRVRLHRRRLDRDLAAGADPDATPELRHRARQLCEVATRRQFAAVLDRIRKEAAGDRRPFESASPLAREAIRGCTAEVEAIVDQLQGSAPLSPHGVAMVAVLLHDPESPLLLPKTSQADLQRTLESTSQGLARV